jgi:hypothetical protein
VKIHPHPALRPLIVFVLLLKPVSSFADHREPGSNHHLTTCQIHYPSDRNIEWKCIRIARGQPVESTFPDQWKDLLRFNRIDRRHAYPGISLKVPDRIEEIRNFDPMPEAFPEASEWDRFILIDLTEQFLAGYHYGRKVLSFPVSSGDGSPGRKTPDGNFVISAAQREHASSLYQMEQSPLPYPMNYALLFYVDRNGISYWIHGRDVPGYPASHGCIGLYDEEMQKKYYRDPASPLLHDARDLFEWVMGESSPKDKRLRLIQGLRVRIRGRAPRAST